MAMRLSIRWKLILAITLPLILVGSAYFASEYRSLREAAYRRAGDYLQEYVLHSAAALDGRFAAAAGVASATAMVLEVHPGFSRDELEGIVRANVQRNPFVYGSCVAFEPGAFEGLSLFAPYAARNRSDDLAGREGAVLTIDIGADAYDYRTWEWYAKAKELDRLVWTEPYFDEGAGNIVMTTCSVPFHRGGALAGIATVDVHLERLQEWGRIEPVPGAAFTILSREGRFISHPKPEFIMAQTIFTAPGLADRPEIQAFGRRLLSAEQGVELIPHFPLDEPCFLAHALMPATGWHYVVAIPESAVMAPVFARLRSFAISALLAILLLVGIVLLVSIRITRPVRLLSREIARVGEGDLDTPIGGTYPGDEIGSLAEAFREMVTRLRNHVDALQRETARREQSESELRIARNIQESLIPHVFPPFPERRELDLHAVLQPARHVGGDFYDFFFTSESDLVLAIADVCGKGVPAAMLMAVTRTLLRTVAQVEPSPARVMARLNAALATDNPDCYFVTMILVHYDVRTGALRYANAGHPPPLRIGAGGASELGQGTGPVLGILADAEHGEGVSRLESGETLVFFTDGATEAMAPGGELYGDQRLAARLASLQGSTPRELCEAVVAELDRFQAGEPADDLTLIALRRR